MRGVDGEGGLLVGGGVLEAGATRHHLGGIRLVHLLHGRELLRRTRLSHCLDHDLRLLRPRCRPTRTCKYHQHQTPPSPVLPHRGSVWPATAPATPSADPDQQISPTSNSTQSSTASQRVSLTCDCSGHAVGRPGPANITNIKLHPVQYCLTEGQSDLQLLRPTRTYQTSTKQVIS